MNKIFLGVIGAAATILGASAASAVTIDGITVNEYGRVNPAGPDYAQPGFGTGTAQIQIGQPMRPEILLNLTIPAGTPTASATRPTPGGTSRAAKSRSTGRATL